MDHSYPKAPLKDTIMYLIYPMWLLRGGSQSLREKQHRSTSQSLKGKCPSDRLWHSFDPHDLHKWDGGDGPDKLSVLVTDISLISRHIEPIDWGGEEVGGLPRGDDSQRGLNETTRHSQAPYFVYHQWLPNQMSPICRSKWDSSYWLTWKLSQLSANGAVRILHSHQPVTIAEMSELGRGQKICHWCMRLGKIQCLLAWQCWPGLSIKE